MAMSPEDKRYKEIEDYLDEKEKELKESLKGVQQSVEATQKHLHGLDISTFPKTSAKLKALAYEGEGVIEMLNKLIEAIDDMQIDDLALDEDVYEALQERIEKMEDRLEESEIPEERDINYYMNELQEEEEQERQKVATEQQQHSSSLQAFQHYKENEVKPVSEAPKLKDNDPDHVAKSKI